MSLLIAAGATSCQNNTLDSGTQGLTVNFNPSPSGTGRFNRGSFDVQSIRFRPSDPNLAATFGSTNLSLRFGNYTADMTQTTATFYSNVALSAGTYQVRLITLGSPSFVDTDATDPAAACHDRISGYPSGPAALQVPSTFQYSNPANLTFTIHPGQTVLKLTADIPGIIDAFKSSFTCSDDCDGQGNPCLVSFDEAAFTSAYLSKISLQ